MSVTNWWFFTWKTRPSSNKKIININFGKNFITTSKFTLLINKKEIKFVVTDFNNEIVVSYIGTVPNLFLEGKGVVAEGKLQDKNFFIADRILAKHDEKYMPKEVIKSLEKEGIYLYKDN